MKILILGSNGQVGWELTRSLAPLGQIVAWDHASADLEDHQKLIERVRAAAPEIIVNAAAYTSVDHAESEPDIAFSVNAEAVRLLAEHAKESGACLVHYSSDYVFDGESSVPYVETDTPRPLSVYGKSKLAGEEALRATGCKHILFRTSWVFASRGHNFPHTILRLAHQNDGLRIVCDQHGAPTSARLIARITQQALERMISGATTPAFQAGTYHLAPHGETSWHDYACFIVQEAIKHGYKTRSGPDQIVPIPTSDYPQPACRPLNSRLNTEKLERALDIELPSWQTDVALTVKDIITHKSVQS